jgi:hypothetical protein
VGASAAPTFFLMLPSWSGGVDVTMLFIAADGVVGLRDLSSLCW